MPRKKHNYERKKPKICGCDLAQWVADKETVMRGWKVGNPFCYGQIFAKTIHV